MFLFGKILFLSSSTPQFFLPMDDGGGSYDRQSISEQKNWEIGKNNYAYGHNNILLNYT